MTETVKVSETKILDTISEQIERGEYENHSDDKKAHHISIEEDVKYFTAYPLPPSALILSNSKPTTNNPLDNLKDFPAWKSTEIHDIPGNHENEIEDNESIYIDQLAVESEQNQHSVAPTIVRNHSPIIPEEVSLTTSKTSLSDLESDSSDPVTSSSENAPRNKG